MRTATGSGVSLPGTVSVTMMLRVLCLFGIWSVSVNAYLQPHRALSFQPRGLLSRSDPKRVALVESVDSSWRTRRQQVLQELRPFHRSIDDTSLCASSSNSEDFVEAEDLEALQVLFSKYCDKQGLMTKAAVMQVPAIADLMADGDLLPEEFAAIWAKAPKFPDVETSEVRVDVDSFVAIYRDIDDLFEADESAESNPATGAAVVSNPSKADVTVRPASVSSAATPVVATIENEEDDEVMEAELESIFESLCDNDKLVSKDIVKAWDEASKLMEDGLLGEEEFDDLWQRTKKSPGSDDKLDVDGFLSFNVALDGLFEFDDEEMDDDEVNIDDEVTIVTTSSAAASSMPTPVSQKRIDGEGLTKKELYSALTSDSKGKLSRDKLTRWGDLQDLLDDGDLTGAELDALFSKASKGKKELDLNGFMALTAAIDDLFEDIEDSEADTNSISLKQDLLDLLEDFNDPDLLPCGLDCSEGEQQEVLKLVSNLEQQSTNLIRARNGEINSSELNGSWDLLYSSSSAMRFNKGLSGLGGSFPNGKFGGLKQILKSNKFVSDVEYIERIEVNPSAASFDVTVTGDWDLRSSVSLFTGEPTLVMTVEPGRVVYGPTSTRADHWKSLGPLNMLDISYLDDDLRIMRGSTAVDSIFIFRRSAS